MNKFNIIKEVYDSIVNKYTNAPATKDTMADIMTDIAIKTDCYDELKCDFEINSSDMLNDGVIICMVIYDRKLNGSYSFVKLPFGNEVNFWKHTKIQ
jgi:hypothetical protein